MTLDRESDRDRDRERDTETTRNTDTDTNTDTDAAAAAFIDAAETLPGVPLTHEILAPELWAALAARFAFSRRELEILQAVFDGDRNDRIAYRLGLSSFTIRSYSRRIYQKTGTTDRPELILAIMAAVLQIQANGQDPDPGSDPDPGTGGSPIPSPQKGGGPTPSSAMSINEDPV